MKYFLGTMIGINLTLIWLLGMYITKCEARLTIIEYKQVGIETAQEHTLARMEKATKDMVTEVRKLIGDKK